jgi:hypothetical protein
VVVLDTLDAIEDLPMYGSFREYINYANPSDTEIIALIKPHLQDVYDALNLFEGGLLPKEAVLDLIKDLNEIVPPFVPAEGCLLKNITGNSYILLLKVCNNAFYKYCILNKISIPRMMVKRPCDTFIENKELKLNALNSREVLIVEQNIGFFDLPGIIDLSHPFIWSSHYYDDSAHFIKTNL